MTSDNDCPVDIWDDAPGFCISLDGVSLSGKWLQHGGWRMEDVLRWEGWMEK